MNIIIKYNQGNMLKVLKGNTSSLLILLAENWLLTAETMIYSVILTLLLMHLAADPPHTHTS